MDVIRIISELDTEISRLQQIRAALTGIGEVGVTNLKGKRGRPKGSKNIPKAASEIFAAKSIAKKASTKRKLTPEGRKRIADAVKRRWATHRKAAGK